MPDYTLCPKLIEYAGKHKRYINDVLMVFVPDNSKKICLDRSELLTKEYESIIQNDKELIDWYKFMTMYQDISITKVDLDDNYQNLLLHVCEKSYDKTLLTDCKANFSDLKGFIEEKRIKLLDKDLAKFELNYGTIEIPKFDLFQFGQLSPDNVFEIVLEICQQFKSLVEKNGLFKLLVDKEGTRVPENKAQLLFFGIALSNCKANNLKLSPEVDSGNGPVDFNVSQGFVANINVEMKFADNPKLEGGLWSQLQIYNEAETAYNSIYLVIKTNNEYDNKIDKLKRVLDYRKDNGESLPELIIVDSTYKESASRR